MGGDGERDGDGERRLLGGEDDLEFESASSDLTGEWDFPFGGDDDE